MTVEPQRARTDTGRFIAGDSLRGLACLVIVFWHVAVNAAGLTGPPGVSPGFRAELSEFGPPVVHMWISVWFFFVLSGYLISGPFVRAVVRGDGRRPRAGAYTRNRVLRILPGYWFWLLVTLVVVGTAGDSLERVGRFFAFAHVYDQGPFTDRFVQAWTLDVEVVFYALVPLLLLPLAALLQGRFTPAGRAGIVLAGLALIGLPSLLMGELGPRDGNIVAGSAWAFVPGIALATIEPLVRPRLKDHPRGAQLAWAVLALAVGAYLVHTYAELSPVLQNAAAAIACGALLGAPLVLQWSTGRTWRALCLPALHWIGVRSYGIYLSHVLVIYELRHLTRALDSTALALLVTFPLALTIATILGALSYRFVELPFLERRVPWRSATPAASPEPALAVSK